MNLRLHGFLPHSRANGPGRRAVIWVQGCSLGCPGCFNPETHAMRGGETVAVADLLQRIVALSDSIEGLTISGGEPLQQRRAVTELLRRIRSETNLSIILLTGFTWEEVIRVGTSERKSVAALERSSVIPSLESRNEIQSKRSHAPDTEVHPYFLKYIDVLIAGRYDQQRRLACGLRGSANKTVHFITGRYTAEDLDAVPHAEVLISPHGEVILSGIRPVAWGT